VQSHGIPANNNVNDATSANTIVAAQVDCCVFILFPFLIVAVL